MEAEAENKATRKEGDEGWIESGRQSKFHPTEGHGQGPLGAPTRPGGFPRTNNYWKEGGTEKYRQPLLNAVSLSAISL